MKIHLFTFNDNNKTYGKSEILFARHTKLNFPITWRRVTQFNEMFFFSLFSFLVSVCFLWTVSPFVPMKCYNKIYASQFRISFLFVPHCTLVYTMYLSEIRYLQATRQNLPLHYDIKRSNRVGKMLETKLNVNCVDSIFSMKKWCCCCCCCCSIFASTQEKTPCVEKSMYGCSTWKVLGAIINSRLCCKKRFCLWERFFLSLWTCLLLKWRAQQLRRWRDFKMEGCQYSSMQYICYADLARVKLLKVPLYKPNTHIHIMQNAPLSLLHFAYWMNAPSKLLLLKATLTNS